MELDPAELDSGTRYKLLIGLVTPRPIAFVSSVSAAGLVNLAPFSFYNAAGADPMAVVFCPVTRLNGTDKDTLRNVLPPEQGGVGEFVVNLATERYARQLTATADELPFEADELELAGFSQTPSARVRPPRVAESPACLECRTLHVVRLAPGVPRSGNLVIGEVVHVHLSDGLINERFHVDESKLATIGRMAGVGYTRTRERFDLSGGMQLLAADPPFPEDTGTPGLAASRARLKPR